MDQDIRDELRRAFDSDISAYKLEDVPLLAHYTSISTLEMIMKTDQLWFSNPLNMNDHEEVSFGINSGEFAVVNDPILKQHMSEQGHQLFIDAFLRNIRSYGESHLFNTYVFCLSEHGGADVDGLLSMWRGYGGDGTGAAIVFDPRQLTQLGDSPLILDRVEYKTREERGAWLKEFVAKIYAAIKHFQFSDEDLIELAGIAFERLKIAAIFSKHKGFDEEREWRVVYMPDRDKAESFHKYFGYLNGLNGLEPKLKFHVEPIPGISAPDLSLEKLIHRIIIGPSRSSPLIEGSARRMLDHAGKSSLIPRMIASQIPFRSSRKTS